MLEHGGDEDVKVLISSRNERNIGTHGRDSIAILPDINFVSRI